MKAINKCLKLLTASSLCIAVTTPIIALSSCSEDLQIKSIFIKPQRQTVEPGKYVQMLLYCEPRKAKKPAVKWELVNLPEEYKTITIDSKGRINVPLMLEVNDAIRIEVKATVESQPTLTASSSVFLVPIGSKGFIGFENGEIGYLDPNSEETSMKIIPKGNKKYETEKMIDLFEITSSTKKRAWTAPINFTPIFVGDGVNKYMQFTQIHEGGKPAALTYMGYSDGSDTYSIPDFYVQDSSFPTTDLKVTFSCDPDVEFIIHFRLWQNRTQTTSGRTLYFQDPEASTKKYYEIKMQDAGQYICNLYCPIKKTETDNTVFSDTLSRVVSFGGLKEFADFDIVFDTSIMSPEVKEAFKIDSSTTDKVIDPFDLTPYWLTSFTYSFDTSKMKPTIEYEYQSFYLFKLAIHDRWVEKPDEYIGWCTFSIQWMDDEA